MGYLIFKYAITAGLVVLVSEFAKVSDKLGGFVAALPLITILTLIWLFLEKQPDIKIANHAYYTFWYVLPTLPMLLLFSYGMSRWGFWIALSISLIATVVIFILYAHILKRFGIQLM